jgi:hypothetical protein
MPNVKLISSLIANGVIRMISYSFEINIDLEGDPEFVAVVEGNGWKYFPTAKKTSSFNKVTVPGVVVQAFDGNYGYGSLRLFFATLFNEYSDKDHQGFFDNLLITLEADGYAVKKWKDPKKQPNYSDCREVCWDSKNN